MQHHLAVHGEGSDRGDARHQREQQQVDRQPPEVAHRDGRAVLRVAREVAEVEVERGEVGDPGRADGGERPERAGLAGHAGVLGLLEQHGLRDGVVEREAARLHAQADRQHQHRHPDGGAGPVLEAAHGLHAALNDEELKGPDDDEADHLQRRMAEQMAGLMELEHALVADQQRDDRAGRGRRLRAVPEAGDDGAHDGREVGAPYAEGGARQHREGDTGPDAGDAD